METSSQVDDSGLRRISDLVDQHAAATPDAEALVLGAERVTYRELKARVDATARALLAAGVAKGDRVATLATPHPDYFVTFLASASIGAIWLGLNPRYRPEELAYVAGDADPRVLFTRTSIDGRSYAEEIDAIRRAAPSLTHCVALDDPAGMPAVVARPAFLAAGEVVQDAALARARQSCGGRDPCLIVYTSGSTGKPKGALLHHEACVEFSLAQDRVWPLYPQRFLNYFPINHVGCVLDVSCPTLAAGGCIVFMEQFEPRASLELMQRERITAWASVPSVFQMQLALPDFESFDLSAVQLVIWEGAAMPVEVIRRLSAMFPRLATNYGMTETTVITVVEPTDDLDVLANSVGWPFEGVEVRLVGPDGGIVAAGMPGEIQARSRYNLLGYWRRPAESAEAYTADGYFRTGDVAVQRPDGRYRIVGRLKEMYKSGGYNVYPREVEAVLETHPAVTMAAVVARPDRLWDEVGVAFLQTSAAVDAADLERYCRERLANYKVPKQFVLCAELPLLPIGKVDKITLRQRAAELSGS